MKRFQGSYALIQFSAVPDRMEFLNVGLLVMAPDAGYFRVRFAHDHPRVERLFGRPHLMRLNDIKAGVAHRLEMAFRDDPLEGLGRFSARRANEIRITPLMPLALDAEHPDLTFDALFDELVGEDGRIKRKPRMARRLKEAFVKAGVYGVVEERPAPIELPEGIKIQTPFGYQNGAYNMIDGLQLSSDPKVAMRDVGMRAFEGARLWKHFLGSDSPHRLIAVVDVSEQSEDFYAAVQEELAENEVRLYRLDQLDPLIDDINYNASLHS